MSPMSTSVGGPLHNSMIYNFIMLEGYDYEACEIHWNITLVKLEEAVIAQLSNIPGSLQVSTVFLAYFRQSNVPIISVD